MSTAQDFDAFVDFDFEGDDLDSDGGRMPLPEGYYQFCLTNFTPRHEKSGNMDVELEVTAAENPKLVGKVHHEFPKWPGPELSEEANNLRKRFQRELIYALGLATKEQLKATPRMRLDFSKAIGAICYGQIKHDEYNGKVSAKLEHDYHLNLWHPDSPEGQTVAAKLGATASEPQAQDGGAFGDDLAGLL